MTNRVVTAHIPDALARRLDGHASRIDRPRGWVLKTALEDYLALDEERHHQTLAALAEVESGTTVDHADVRAWATSLSGKRRKGQAGKATRK
jgi:predicted transcriptional regulator